MSDTPLTDANETEAITGLGRCVGVNFARKLERDNARLQMELDASCNAEELRQYRHANQFLITNQGAYERENARLREACNALAKALKTTPYDECHQLDHKNGNYHKSGEPCAVVASNKAALLLFNSLPNVQAES